MADNVNGRAVLVTGGVSGIGRAIAMRFAASPARRVAILDKAPANAGTELLGKLDGPGHVFVQVDLADADAVLASVDLAAGQLGGLDVLVNNAGVFPSHHITDASYLDWQQHWRTHPRGQPDRRRQRDLVRGQGTCGRRRRRIVNVSSAGRLPRRAGRAGLRGQQGRPELLSASRWRSRSRRTGSRFRPWHPGSSRTEMTTEPPQAAGRRRHQGAEPVRPGRRAGRDRR